MPEKVSRYFVFGVVLAVLLWVALLPIDPMPLITPTVYETTHPAR